MNFHVAIIGGGLAGLALSIDLRRMGYTVAVIEKGAYPRHKVCGEYIAMESHDYLHGICPQLNSLYLPRISGFKLSSTGKKEFQTQLHPGGFGISRYLLEDLLFKDASQSGITFFLQTKATEVIMHSKNSFTVNTNHGSVDAEIICNSSGRKSIFETQAKTYSRIQTNYIGIKYHIKIRRDSSQVEIHNFPGGYCGISDIEDGKSCLCYIVNSQQLKSTGNSIPELEKLYLQKNKELNYIFENAEFVYKDPVTISGINFLIKKTSNEKSIFLGDAAGSIAPITGNGMSIALKSAHILSKMIDNYFNNKVSNTELNDQYTRFWKNEFSTRIKLSRYFQKLSEYPFLTNNTIKLFNLFPTVANKIISLTHGKPFYIASHDTK